MYEYPFCSACTYDKGDKLFKLSSSMAWHVQGMGSGKRAEGRLARSSDGSHKLGGQSVRPSADGRREGAPRGPRLAVYEYFYVHNLWTCMGTYVCSRWSVGMTEAGTCTGIAAEMPESVKPPSPKGASPPSPTLSDRPGPLILHGHHTCSYVLPRGIYGESTADGAMARRPAAVRRGELGLDGGRRDGWMDASGPPLPTAWPLTSPPPLYYM